MDWVYLLQGKDDTSRQGRKMKKKEKEKRTTLCGGGLLFGKVLRRSMTHSNGLGKKNVSTGVT